MRAASLTTLEQFLPSLSVGLQPGQLIGDKKFV